VKLGLPARRRSPHGFEALQPLVLHGIRGQVERTAGIAEDGAGVGVINIVGVHGLKAQLGDVGHDGDQPGTKQGAGDERTEEAQTSAGTPASTTAVKTLSLPFTLTA
jgi:hypothetical protein